MSAQDGKNMWASGEVWMGKGESMDAGKARGRWADGGGKRLLSSCVAAVFGHVVGLGGTGFLPCPCRDRKEDENMLCNIRNDTDLFYKWLNCIL